MCKLHKLFLLHILCLLFHNRALHCSANGSDANLETDDDFVVEEEEETEDIETSAVPVFDPTWEWKEVQEGQSIPAGLHVRMNLETGRKEAKLLSPGGDDTTMSKGTQRPTSFHPQMSAHNYLQTSSKEEQESDDSGDTRITGYYGDSDRRGVINKQTKLFSRQELSEMLKNLKDDGADLSGLPQIATTTIDTTGSIDSNVNEPQFTVLGSEDKVPLPLSVHRDVDVMLQHMQTLAAARDSTVFDILHALEELEYYVHQIDNAKDLNTIGGLVLVVRMLNHTAPEVRSHAAHVIGSAAQSNPAVQAELVDYGCLPLLCALIRASETELVQRRALFALSALLRGNKEQQKLFVGQYQGFSVLGETFSDRSALVQLKSVTLLTDLIHEQTDPHGTDVSSQEELLVLFNQVLEFRWCHNVASLLHSESLTRIERGLQAMEVLSEQNICSFAGQLSRLRALVEQLLMRAAELESDIDDGSGFDEEFVKSLADLCSSLVTRIRQLNLEL